MTTAMLNVKQCPIVVSVFFLLPVTLTAWIVWHPVTGVPKLGYICLSEGVHVHLRLAIEGKNMFIHNSLQIIHECEFVCSVSSYFLFWASCSNHCLAALDFGAGVEEPFGCLIVQNRQVVQSIGRSMDWTLENNRVDCLFFCVTLTDRRGGHTPFVQAGEETSDTGAEVVKPYPRCSLESSLIFPL